MGLDLGEKTIGVALSDSARMIAQPFCLIRRTNWKDDIKAILAIAAEKEVSDIVLGLPLSLDGSQGPMAEMVLLFAERLRRRTTIPIHTWDERFSTAAAERTLLAHDARRDLRREVIDQVAAAVFLQAWLDHHGNTASRKDQT